ncbi:MAG: hypothetical protein VX730_09620 [Pseudomonadota bacterium]|nr:hypothetical protein [Pseudomonadota bacterium]
MAKPYILLKLAMLAKKYKAAFFTPVYNQYDKQIVARFFRTKEEMTHYQKTADKDGVFKPSFFFFDMSQPIGAQIISCFEKEMPKLAENRDRLMRFLGAPKDWKERYQALVDYFRKIGHASELPALPA